MPTPPPRRAWGTRFDSLVDSPHDVRPPRDADPALSAEKERSADCDRAHPRSSLSGAPPSSDASPLPARMPHDASVFIASLPSHIPEPELQAHLSAHLSQHATIKHIKLIRDNRGAVCAFVQVESAAQAANLIAACNLTLFMDRHIRCEVARAFRTLLVAWRHPNSAKSADEEAPGKALRLRRCRGSRYIQVSHGADAVLTDITQLPNYSPPHPDDPLSGHGIFFPSGIIEGDFEALKGLVEAFGPLEFITPFEPAPFSVDRNDGTFARGGPGESQVNGENVPHPPRPPIWAAKWEHRNDAVSAFTALQHVPRLFISWSHTYGRPYQPPYTPRGYGDAQSRGSSGMHTPSYPPTPYNVEPNSHTNAEVHNGEGETQWAPRLQHLHAQAVVSNGVKVQEPIAFSESDFPPLRVEENSHSLGGRGRGKRGAWVVRKNFVRAGAPSPPPISTSLPNMSQLYSDMDTPTSGAPQTPDLDSVVEPSPITPGFPITPRTTSGGYAPGDETQKDAGYGYAAFPLRRPEDAPCDGRDIFVGGLDAATWDEERIHSVFGKFGVLEDIRFVKPGFHAPAFKRAFAFIRFADQEASQRAIMEEHLRIYDDRRIKVQLRDVNTRRWAYRGRGRFHNGPGRADRTSFDFDHDDSVTEAVDGEQSMAATGHVRFASAPNMASLSVQTQPDQEGVFENADEPEGAAEGFVEELESGPAEENHVTSSSSSITSDAAPDASMEAQPRSADTTVTLADVTLSHGLNGGSPQREAEQDTSTAVSSTPPPSNPDVSSTYAPSSEGSAPTSTSYYPTPPSWIPPYALPPAPYGPYGYYSQQAPGQPGSEASATYPWMAALYRNVMPFVPWFNPPPGVELAAPPVRPTGYIQRDPGGIFIPVYPPERLGQYMSTSGSAMDQAQPQSQVASAPQGSWQNLPPHPQLYPVPFPMHQSMMMQQQAAAAAAQQQQQLPGNGWITGPPPGAGYSVQQQGAPSSAPPPYPTPNAYFPSQSSAAPPQGRQNMYGPYDPALQHVQKPSNRRGSEYPHRFGPREGRASVPRRGPGANASDHSFSNGAGDHQFSYVAKPNSALPAQLAMTSSGSHGSEWNWNAQNR